VNNTGTKCVRIMKQTAFWRGKNEEYIPCLKFSVPIFLNKYIKWNVRGYRCGTTTIVVVRRQRVNSQEYVCPSKDFMYSPLLKGKDSTHLRSFTVYLHYHTSTYKPDDQFFWNLVWPVWYLSPLQCQFFNFLHH